MLSKASLPYFGHNSFMFPDPLTDLASNDMTILVLGIGNILWADEGFGVRVVECLARDYVWPTSVRLMDGGTQGLFLLPYLENLAGLIIVDAIDFGLPPATIHEVHGADVPATIGARKMSLHQTGFQEVLALLDLRGCSPRRLSLVGVQPVTLDDYGGGLTPAVAALVEKVGLRVLDLLRQDYGLDIAPVELGQQPPGLMAEAVTQAAYESGRPDAETACRHGDERLLARLKDAS